jgi:hypothetical protein
LIAGVEDIPDKVVKRVFGLLRLTCAINNNTQQTLRLDSGRDEIGDDSGKAVGIAAGEYTDFPPSLISAATRLALPNSSTLAHTNVLGKSGIDYPNLHRQYQAP